MDRRVRLPRRQLPKSCRQMSGALVVGALALAAASSAQALTIIPRFDSSITSLANASAVENAFNAVAHDYASSFSNPVTVNVGVSWGSVGGTALPASAVGASMDSLYGYYTYSQVRSDLLTASTRNPTDTALATAAKSLTTTTPGGVSRYLIPSSEAKALGLISGSQASLDGSIGFAGKTSAYDFDPTSGIGAGLYDFEAVAGHEIAEVLGRVGGLSSTSPTFRTPFDLYRYSASGVRDFGYNDAAYFSINGGVTRLANFNNSTSGGDRSDWQTLSTSTDISDAFIQTGRAFSLSAADLTALDVLGWGGSNVGDTKVSTPNAVAFNLINGAPLAVPEPAAWSLMIAGFGLLGATLRRRRAQEAQLQPVRVRPRRG